MVTKHVEMQMELKSHARDVMCAATTCGEEGAARIHHLQPSVHVTQQPPGPEVLLVLQLVPIAPRHIYLVKKSRREGR